MEYPFPEGTLISWNLYCVLEVAAILALFGLSLVPLLRIGMCRERSAQIDTATAAASATASAVIGTGILMLADGWESDATRFLVALGSLAILTNVVWAIFPSRLAPTAIKRMAEIGAPYAVGFAAVCVILCDAPHQRRRTPRRLECLNNLKNLGLAMHNFASANQAYLPDLSGPDDVPHSWRVELLQYLDRADLHRSYRWDRPWDSVENAGHAKTWLKVFRCPNDPNWRKPDARGRYFTAYAGVRGPDTAFPDGHGATLDTISDSDGLGATLLIVEACGQRIIWTEPRDVDLAKDEIGVNLPGDQQGRSRGVLSSYHPGSTNVVFADGSVRPVNNNIDPKVLRALLTATGGESVPPDAIRP